MKTRFLLPILAFVFLAVTLPPKKKKDQNKPLTETHWELIKVFGEEIPAMENPPYIIFETDGKCHGYLGCNQFFCAYFNKKKSISLDYAGATKKLCFNNMEVEEQFLSALRREVKTYIIDKDILIIYDKTKEVLRFVAVVKRDEKDNGA